MAIEIMFRKKIRFKTGQTIWKYMPIVHRSGNRLRRDGWMTFQGGAGSFLLSQTADNEVFIVTVQCVIVNIPE